MSRWGDFLLLPDLQILTGSERGKRASDSYHLEVSPSEDWSSIPVPVTTKAVIVFSPSLPILMRLVSRTIRWVISRMVVIHSPIYLIDMWFDHKCDWSLPSPRCMQRIGGIILATKQILAAVECVQPPLVTVFSVVYTSYLLQNNTWDLFLYEWCILHDSWVY